MPRRLPRLTFACLTLALSLASLRRLPAEPSPSSDRNIRLARSTYEKEFSAGRYAQAVPACQVVLQAAEKMLGPNDQSVAYWLAIVGKAFSELEQYPEAEPLYQRILRIQEKALGPTHPQLAPPLTDLGEWYREQERYAEAEPFYKRV